MSLPDLPRVRLSPPARALAATAVRLTRKLTWRTLHPADRERFLSARPTALERLPYTCADGARGCLFHLHPAAGGSGEPVLLAHALGLTPDAYRLGDDSLARVLSAAGYSVYLLSHRGDDGLPNAGPVPMDFDAIVERDVPAALEAVCSHSGASAVHWIGHGLGGQLGLVAAARGEVLASLVALAAPTRFRRPASEVRTMAMLTRLLPEGFVLPTSWMARAAVPAVGNTWMGDATGEQARGVLEYGTQGLCGGLVDQVSRWIREGRLTSRAGVVDYESTFAAAQCPLLVVHASESRVASEALTCPALDVWGHADALSLCVAGRSSDVLFGRNRMSSVHEPLLDWLDDRRWLAWGKRTVERAS